MSSSSLTAKYRPQNFQDVAGQDSIKAILSRAALEDKIAAAYLFSGTRGVGKTTLARIFAKAINCAKAPCAEPCNDCVQCRQITAGVSVDVVEIDAASNRGIEHARKLKEDIGYAPLDGRYKVFIIDEAHMLTREAFNALLKTLEEPPPRVTFIMATTEPHKFPATIISRSQHYVFKRLTQNQLVDHLTAILNMEQVEFEPGAVALIAKRGAGSVRDSMSLLGQVLALGSRSLVESDVREVLGLAGQEFFFQLMECISDADVAGIGDMVSQILDQGLDLGFFLRELAACWRNMFILSKTGDSCLEMLNMPAEDVDQWRNWANKFQLTHLHACWQMTLEGQKKVLDSLEPAQSLELLLLNLAHLPMLVDFNQFSRLVAATSAKTGTVPQAPAFSPRQTGSGPAPVSGQFQPRGVVQGAPQRPNSGQYQAPQASAQPSAPVQSRQARAPQPSQAPRAPRAPRPEGNYQQANRAPRPGEAASPAPGEDPGPQDSEPGLAVDTGRDDFNGQFVARSPENRAYAPGNFNGIQQVRAPGPPKAPPAPGTNPATPTMAEPVGRPIVPKREDLVLPEPSGERNWENFMAYASEAAKAGVDSPFALKQVKGEYSDNTLTLNCITQGHSQQVQGDKRYGNFVSLAEKFFGGGLKIVFGFEETVRLKKRDELQADTEKHPLVSRFMDDFSAGIESIKQVTSKDK